MKIRSYPYTDVGRVRELNEDALLADDELGLYVVCDGMGGHAAGDLASRTTAATVQRVFQERANVVRGVREGRANIEQAAEVMREAIQTACREVHQMGRDDRSKRGMGTTCVALLVIGTQGVMGNVGDSRLYMSREGQIHQLSEDHTFLREAIKAGVMTPEQAAESAHAHVVTRAVGPQASVIVDTLVIDILPGDTYLLCSDGLHNYTPDESELNTHLVVDDPEPIARGLVQLANDRGGDDNITAIVLRAQPPEQVKMRDRKRITEIKGKFSTLRHVDLFRELTMAELMAVGNAFQRISYPAGAEIIIEGEVSQALFVILEGEAEVKRGDAILARLGPGTHFGDMALLSKRPRTATVRALTEMKLLILERPQFYAVLSQDGILASKFLWKLAQTLALRLDGVYVNTLDAMDGRPTMGLGMLPSPFERR